MRRAFSDVDMQNAKLWVFLIELDTGAELSFCVDSLRYVASTDIGALLRIHGLGLAAAHTFA